ncbi:MAG: hypothetical protein B6U72_06470 [Candidatus Altiarchaeales archaeon ex4484_2]|nr:MAG: hypothetical protein B6U72_06470 [Candidatus Altiarchaeales archaeon ex4484_2]
MMDIKACTRCGSGNLRMPSELEFEIRLTLAGQYKCGGCNFIGFPIVFDLEGNYLRYKSLKQNV